MFDLHSAIYHSIHPTGNIYKLQQMLKSYKIVLYQALDKSAKRFIRVFYFILLSSLKKSSKISPLKKIKKI